MRTIFSLVLLLPIVLGSPFIQISEPFATIPIVARINATGIRNIVEADRARARLFIQKAQEKAEKVKAGTVSMDAIISVPLTNAATMYTASVGVGTPPTQYNLIVDTGSSNTWVGASRRFVPTSSTQDTDRLVEVVYGSAYVFGEEFLDTVILAPDLVIKNQSIGVAIEVVGIEDHGVDGILGLGPTGLTMNTLFLSPDDEIPTIVDNLFSQGTISSDLIGISFEPTTSKSIVNGEIAFGGVNPSKFTGSITFVPITSVYPANAFWGIDQSIKVGTTTILSYKAGIVDTGTTLIMLSTDAFAQYQSITGGVLDPVTTLLRVTSAQFDKLQNLDFIIGGTTFSLTPNAQAWPRALNTALGGNPDDIYLIVNDIGPSDADDEEDIKFVNGMTFLERFYSVYDTGNHRVGLATTPFTNAIIN